MKIIVQRVKKASVKVNNEITGAISHGLLVLIGYTHQDTTETIISLCNKLIGLRIFNDSENKMNLSLTDVKGGLLVVSNFTLYADSKKGFRPSFIEAAKPEYAESLYNFTINYLKENLPQVETGIFGAMMDVELINDGPVTIILEK